MFNRLGKLIKSSVIKAEADKYKAKGFLSKDIIVLIVKEWLVVEDSFTIARLKSGVQFVVESANLSVDDFQSSFTELYEFYQKIGKLKDN